MQGLLAVLLAAVMTEAVPDPVFFSIILQLMIDYKATRPNITVGELKNTLIEWLTNQTDRQFAMFFPTQNVQRKNVLDKLEAMPDSEMANLFEEATAKAREARINKNKIIMLLARQTKFFPAQGQLPDCQTGCYLNAPPDMSTDLLAAHRHSAQPCAGCLRFFNALPTQPGDALKESPPANATPMHNYRAACSLNACLLKDLKCVCDGCLSTRRYGLLWTKIHPDVCMDDAAPVVVVPPVPIKFGPHCVVKMPVPLDVGGPPPTGLTLEAMRQGIAWHANMVRSLPAERCPLPACGHSRVSCGLDGPTQAQDPLWQINWRLGMCTTCVRKLHGHVRLFVSKEGVHPANDPHRFVFETQLLLYSDPHDLQLFNEMIGNAFDHLASLCVNDLDRKDNCTPASPVCVLPATLCGRKHQLAGPPVHVQPSQSVLHDMYIGQLCEFMARSASVESVVPRRNAMYTSTVTPRLYQLFEHYVQPMWQSDQITKLALIDPVWACYHPDWVSFEQALIPGDLHPLSVLRVARVLYESLVEALNALLLTRSKFPLCGSQVVLFASPLHPTSLMVGLSCHNQHSNVDAERNEALRRAWLLCQPDKFGHKVLVAHKLVNEDATKLKIQRVHKPDNAMYFPADLVPSPMPSLVERIATRPTTTLVVRFANRLLGRPLNIPAQDDAEPPTREAVLAQYQTNMAEKTRVIARLEQLEPTPENTELLAAWRRMEILGVPASTQAHVERPMTVAHKTTPQQTLACLSDVSYVLVISNCHAHVTEMTVVREGEPVALMRPMGEPYFGVELLPLYDLQVATGQLGYERTVVLTRPLHELTRQDWQGFITAVGWSQSRHLDGRDWRAHIATFQCLVMNMPRNPFARIPLYKTFKDWWQEEDMKTLITRYKTLTIEPTPVPPNVITLASHIFSAVMAGYHVHNADSSITIETNLLPAVHFVGKQ